MANKAISELPQASNVNNQDLFVLEQSGIAKKLTAETFITEQGIIDALAEALDGHGGIASVTLSSISGRTRTYLITFTDGTTTTFQVLDGTSISRIEKTSTAGLVDTYTVFMTDGTTSFFQVRNGQDGSATWDQINSKAPIITETVTGAIANFPDGADDIPVKDLVVNIEPKQSGSGDPSPDNVRPITGWTGANVTRTGKNLFDKSTASDNTTWTTSGTQGYSAGKTSSALIPVVPSESYYIGFTGMANVYGVYEFDINKNYIGRTFPGALTPRAITLPSNCYYVGLVMDTTYKDTAYFSYSSTATTYEPYQGTTYTVDWTTEAGTVYGGTLDVTTGVLTVDRAIVDLGTLRWTQISTQSPHWRFWAYLSEMLQNSTLVSTQYVQITPGSQWNGSIGVATQLIADTPAVMVSDERYETAADFKTAMSGVQLVYQLATPQTYQLTPQQLKTLYGTNNVWADTGDTSVTYSADTKIYLKLSKVVLTATIVAADWASSDPYTNSVSVNGLLATDTPIMDLIASSTYATAQAETADYAYIYKATCADNTLMLYASQAPTVDLNVQLLCLR